MLSLLSQANFVIHFRSSCGLHLFHCQCTLGFQVAFLSLQQEPLQRDLMKSVRVAQRWPRFARTGNFQAMSVAISTPTSCVSNMHWELRNVLKFYYAHSTMLSFCTSRGPLVVVSQSVCVGISLHYRHGQTLSKIWKMMYFITKK